MKKSAILLTLLAAAAPAFAVTPAELKEKGEVRIGVFSDKPPFGYVDKEGVSQGFDVEIGRYIAKDLLGDENKAKFVLVEAANRVEFLRAGKVDIILANFTVTPERTEVVDFAKPYMKVALGVVSPDKAVIKSIDDLKGKTLLLNKGTTADRYFSKEHRDIKSLKFDQNTETFNALLDGRGDALAHDNTLLLAWAKEHPGYSVGIARLGSDDFIAPAVAKGDDELHAYLDSKIEEIQKNGVLQAAYEKTLKPIFGDQVPASEILVTTP
ncbi:MAG: cysteine ABC transporter substrate-binding protein [Cardiobacteriaceae bacterium]|nr:cysteine ABC transporter substrate-binding protein [Cardiobacteriaceae bacterium]